MPLPRLPWGAVISAPKIFSHQRDGYRCRTAGKDRRSFCSENLLATALRSAFNVQELVPDLIRGSMFEPERKSLRSPRFARGSKFNVQKFKVQAGKEYYRSALRQLDYRECHGISKDSTETRLPVAILFHVGFFITFPEFRKRRTKRS